MDFLVYFLEYRVYAYFLEFINANPCPFWSGGPLIRVLFEPKTTHPTTPLFDITDTYCSFARKADLFIVRPY
jgi:hypothetical protein